MARLLNRAYEQLNKVLSLAGSQSLNDVDLDQAFAVHPLDAVVQHARAIPFGLGYLSSTINGAVGRGLNPFQDIWAQSTVLGESWDHVPAGYDVFLVGMGVSVNAVDQANFTSAQFEVAINGLTNANQPVTTVLDQFNSPNLTVQPQDADPLWRVKMPLRIVDGLHNLQVELTATAVVSCRLYIQGIAYPPGVFPKWP